VTAASFWPARWGCRAASQRPLRRCSRHSGRDRTPGRRRLARRRLVSCARGSTPRVAPPFDRRTPLGGCAHPRALRPLRPDRRRCRSGRPSADKRPVGRVPGSHALITTNVSPRLRRLGTTVKVLVPNRGPGPPSIGHRTAPRGHGAQTARRSCPEACPDPCPNRCPRERPRVMAESLRGPWRDWVGSSQHSTGVRSAAEHSRRGGHARSRSCTRKTTSARGVTGSAHIARRRACRPARRGEWAVGDAEVGLVEVPVRMRSRPTIESGVARPRRFIVAGCHGHRRDGRPGRGQDARLPSPPAR
jgi:hypothetical protein